MKFGHLMDVRLDLFDGGGSGAAAPGQAASEGQGETRASSAHTRRGKSGEFQNVLFGKQGQTAPAGEGTQATEPPAAGEDKQDGAQTAPEKTLKERRKAYRELVEGEYKDLYTEDTQRIINRRFTADKEHQEYQERTQPVIDLLLQRYKIADGDVGKLAAAIESDNSYWADAADQAGMSVEQYKVLQKLQLENARLLQAQRRAQSEQAAQQQLQKWYGEAEQVKARYPGFELEAEVKDPQFLKMLQAGVPVAHAYEVIHMEDIKAGVAQTQAQATEKQVVESIRAKGVRPAENGTASQSAFTVRDDVHKLTKAERADIARRAARGEKIVF